MFVVCFGNTLERQQGDVPPEDAQWCVFMRMMDDDNNNKQETKDYKSIGMFEIIRKTIENLGNRYLA